MKLWFRNLVAIPLLGWLPLQAAALPALALLCEMDPGAQCTATRSGIRTTAITSTATAATTQTTGVPRPAGPHTCCHHFFSAALPSLSTVVGPAGVRR